MIYDGIYIIMTVGLCFISVSFQFNFNCARALKRSTTGADSRPLSSTLLDDSKHLTGCVSNPVDCKAFVYIWIVTMLQSVASIQSTLGSGSHTLSMHTGTGT
jgi:hypothetical protein